MSDAIKTKDDLLKWLLYEKDGQIITGVSGGCDINEQLSDSLIKELTPFLKDSWKR